jgi:hypothetical protein
MDFTVLYFRILGLISNNRPNPRTTVPRGSTLAEMPSSIVPTNLRAPEKWRVLHFYRQSKRASAAAQVGRASCLILLPKGGSGITHLLRDETAAHGSQSLL